MPIYEYDCPVCGPVEAIQKMSDKPLKECPNCLEKGKHTKVTKMVSNASFQLKGSGWYKTDYASSGSSSSGSKSKSSSESKDSAKTESKSDSDSKAKPAKSCTPGCGCH
ncbi:MAG: zinc ribbon domain-containing protein [Deltaproteobacteria bacterium]|nr:zinc ribbon domain-containing protein [Deltaproteobacteria bacterium]